MSHDVLRAARVMVVDDRPDNVAVVVQGLVDAGVAPLAFTDPFRALHAATLAPPDAFVLDLAMPGMDGAELARRLRAQPTSASTPVLFLTASDDPRDVDRTFEAGGSDYVVKPVRLPELIARLAVHVERERHRRELERSTRLLEEAAAFRETVDAVFRHDLKNPLNALVGLSSVLARDDVDDETRVDVVDRIQRAAQRMLVQVERSLDLVRIERGMYDEDPVPVDVDATLGDVVRGLAPMAAVRDVRLGLSVDGPRPVRALGDGDLLHGALSNLVRNAVEAAAETSGGVSVDVARRDREVVVTIVNDGDVPVEIRDRFFEKYATSGKVQGTGLGTYSARAMLRASSGDVSLVSSGTGRTVVEVMLPEVPAQHGRSVPEGWDADAQTRLDTGV